MNTLFCRSVIFAVFFFIFIGTAPGMTETEFVTITLPEKVIEQSIKSSLPLSIKPDASLLAGSLMLDSIDRFELGENSAKVHGLILGKNLVLATRMGNQDLRLKLGELHLPLTCTFTFRFDPQVQKLYITPHLADSLTGAPPEQANKALPVLALLNNREYPISLESIKRFETKIGQRNVTVEMKPMDIQISPSALILKMVPTISKTD